MSYKDNKITITIESSCMVVKSNDSKSLEETKYFLDTVNSVKFQKYNFTTKIDEISDLTSYYFNFSIFWMVSLLFTSFYINHPELVDKHDDYIYLMESRSWWVENYTILYYVINFLCLGVLLIVVPNIIRNKFFDFKKRFRYLLVINEKKWHLYFKDTELSKQFYDLLLHEIKVSKKI